MDMNYAKGWKPDEGALLIGTVVNVDFGWSDYKNDEYPIITVKPDDGSDDVAVHCFHTALYSRVMALRPVAGEKIGIQYKGKEPSKSNPRNTVAKYVVRIEGRTSDPWAGRRRPEQQARSAQSPPEQSDVPADAEDFKPAAPDDGDDIPF